MDKQLKVFEYGQSQFDEMSREELITHCQRFYAATKALVGVAEACRHGQEDSPYWTIGTGARGLAKGEQALAKSREGCDRESLYIYFYRYAVDLLFDPVPEFQIGFNWYICESCQSIIGRDDLKDGVLCRDVRFNSDCDGIVRKLQWSDLNR